MPGRRSNPATVMAESHDRAIGRLLPSIPRPLHRRKAMHGVYEVPEEHREFLEGIRAIVDGRVAPRAADIDRTSEYPQDIRDLFGEANILALPFGEEHGGTGTGTLMLQMAVEEIARVSASCS